MTQNHVFVAREREISQLNTILESVLQGNGQVCFIAGDAGIGKTTLVNEFSRLAQEAVSDLVVAIGQSDAQTGIGDSYLPFRELLAQLTGDVEARLAQGSMTEENEGRLKKFVGFSGQAIVELGPDLIGVFVPGAGLATRAAAFVAEKIGWLDNLERLTSKSAERVALPAPGIDQQHIYEQYTNVLIRLADKQPLLIVLDDLQWADAASIGLLFRLGRRISSSRILLLGTYRPAEVAMGRAGDRHPLEKARTEFKRYFGDIEINLNETGEEEAMHFVRAFLETEANGLGDDFRQALYNHTGGHPLFTIELLRAMQERRAIIQDDQGRWVENDTLDWETLPARVEGVIEERIGRLEDDLKEILTVASVEGEVFTAEVVAQVQSIEARHLIRQMSRALERKHRLVSMQGSRQLHDSQKRLSFYRFQHNLFQKYLYGILDEAERVYLHEDIGHFLEVLYGDHVDEIAVQLARHFSEAGVADKARIYLFKAGTQATAFYANEEALGYYARTLEMTPDADLEARYDILLAREKVLDRLGRRDAQGDDLDSAAALTDKLGSDDEGFALRKAKIALRRAGLADTVGDFAAIPGLCREVIEYAQQGRDVDMEGEAHRRWGLAVWHQGDLEQAKVQFRLALEIAQANELKQVEAKTMACLGQLNGSIGNFPEGQKYYEHILEFYKADGNRQGESSALNGLAIIAAQQGKLAEAQENFEKALAIMRQIGERRAEGMVISNLGAIAYLTHDYARARARFLQGMQVHRETDDKRGICMVSVDLGGALIKLGDFAAARDYLEEALQISREIGLRQAEAQSQAYLCLLHHYLGDTHEVYLYSQQVVDIAEEVGDRATLGTAYRFQGHALSGLGRLEEAVDAYQQALTLRRELGQEPLAMETLAGLAEASWALGRQAQVRDWIEELLAHLDPPSLANKEEPLYTHLVVYRILAANEDPRAADVLESAMEQLDVLASKIDDKDLRESFLENIPIHRAIRQAYREK